MKLYSLVLDQNGAVYAFGAGRTGCLGLGDNENQMYPVMISEFGKLSGLFSVTMPLAFLANCVLY